MSALNQLDELTQSLAALRAGDLGAAAFCTAARRHQTLWQALPPRYGEVLSGLLDRLESSALFTEESCSFSQRDLLDSLSLWADKARAQLETRP